MNTPHPGIQVKNRDVAGQRWKDGLVFSSRLGCHLVFAYSLGTLWMLFKREWGGE